MCRPRSRTQSRTNHEEGRNQQCLQRQGCPDRMQHQVHTANGKTGREHPQSIQCHESPTGDIGQQRLGVVDGISKTDGCDEVDLCLEQMDPRIAPVFLHQPVLVPQYVLQEERKGQCHPRRIGWDGPTRFQPGDGTHKEETQIQCLVRQLMKQTDPVEVSAQSLVEHSEGRSDHEDDAGPTEEDGAAFGNVHVAECLGPAATAASCIGLDQFPTPLEGEAQEEATESKEEAGWDGMALKCSGASHVWYN